MQGFKDSNAKGQVIGMGANEPFDSLFEDWNHLIPFSRLEPVIPF